MRLAVVIPVLDEERVLESTLLAARAATSLDDLLVVSDGGSRDASPAIAARAGALVVRGAAGRGPQLNRGALAALEGGAEALIFVHADTLLPVRAGALVREALVAGAPGGGFLLAFDRPTALLRLGERLVNFRSRYLGMLLGDQALFATRQAFEHVGGFPDWPILEDVELRRRLRRLGKLAILEPPVVTAARRFRQRGVARTVARNWLIWTLHAVGVSPQRLARIYRHVR